MIKLCKDAGLLVVAGGPLFTVEHEHFPDVDHFVLNEAELTLPGFLLDLFWGRAKRVYSTDRFADIEQTPVPRWDLLELDQYASMSVQYSRGCPFNCDFCNVTALLGRTPRNKSAPQMIAELDALYAQGRPDGCGKAFPGTTCGRHDEHHAGHDPGVFARRIQEHPEEHLFARGVLCQGDHLFARVQPAEQYKSMANPALFRKPGGPFSIHSPPGHSGQGKIQVMEAVLLDPVPASKGSAAGRDPGHLRLSFPTCLRIAGVVGPHCREPGATPVM